MLRNGLLSIFVGLALVAAACGGGSSKPDSGAQEDAHLPQFDGGQQQQDATPDSATAGDNNDNFDQSIDLGYTTSTTNNAKTGTINPKGDKDYYKFQGTAGDWIAIFTDANPDCTQGKLDPVVTLYDSSQAQIAQNDDQVSGVNCDPFLITRLTATGTYYVMIQDWFQFYYPDDQSQWQGGPLFTYKIYLMKLDSTVDGVLIDPETGNDLASAATLTFPSGSAGSLLGTFANATDVDGFKFNLAVNSSVYFTFQADGVDGNGSTSSFGQAYITDSTGATTLALIDGTHGATDLQPPLLPAGDYVLWVAAPGGSIGANPFYTASDFTGTTDNPSDAEGENTGTNDTPGTAEALTESSTAGSYFVLSHLPTNGDVDYYKVTLAASTTLAVACGARRNGSGVDGLTATVYGPDGTTQLASDTETLDHDLMVGPSTSPLNISTAGDYYVKLSKTGQVANVTGTWIRCGIHSRAQ